MFNFQPTFYKKGNLIATTVTIIIFLLYNIFLKGDNIWHLYMYFQIFLAGCQCGSPD